MGELAELLQLHTTAVVNAMAQTTVLQSFVKAKSIGMCNRSSVSCALLSTASNFVDFLLLTAICLLVE